MKILISTGIAIVMFVVSMICIAIAQDRRITTSKSGGIQLSALIALGLFLIALGL